MERVLSQSRFTTYGNTNESLFEQAKRGKNKFLA